MLSPPSEEATFGLVLVRRLLGPYIARLRAIKPLIRPWLGRCFSSRSTGQTNRDFSASHFAKTANVGTGFLPEWFCAQPSREEIRDVYSAHCVFEAGVLAELVRSYNEQTLD